MKSNGKPQKLRGATYIRMSTGNQEDSPARQTADIKTIPGYKDARIIARYQDDAISGTDMSACPDFNRMLADAELGSFDILFVDEQSRLSREHELDCLENLNRLRRSGVRIITKLQGELNFDDIGGLIKAIVTSSEDRGASLKTSFRVCGGKHEVALRGEWPRKPMHGYRHKNPSRDKREKDHHLVLIKDQAAFVKLVFRINNTTETSSRKIAREVSIKGYRTPEGELWTGRLIQGILTQPAYKGTAIWNRSQRAKFHTVIGDEVVKVDNPGRKLIVKDEGDWVLVPCPRVVSDEVWDEAQRRVKARKFRCSPAKPGEENPYLLSGLMFCAHCGGTMHGIDSKDRIRYGCSTYNKWGTLRCNSNNIKQDVLMRYLGRMIRDWAMSDETFERTRTAVRKRLSSVEKSDNREAIKQLRRQLKALDKDIGLGIAELKRTPDDLYDAAVADVRKMRANREQLSARLEDEETASAAAPRDIEAEVQAIMAQAHGLSEIISGGQCKPSTIREALRSLVTRIDLSFSHRQTASGRTQSAFDRGIIALSGGLVGSAKDSRPEPTLRPHSCSRFHA